MNVLIADDDPVVRHILSAILSSGEFSVEMVESGRECLDTLQQHAQRGDLPQVLFLDIQLQDMAGTEVLREVRAKLGDQAPKVIALSGNSKEEVLAIDPEFSPDFFLEKPFEATTVLELLETVKK